MCESGIELAPGLFQSVGNRLWFGTAETGLPLWSTWSTFILSLDDAVIGIIVMMVVEAALDVVAFVAVIDVLAEMVILLVAGTAVLVAV